MAFSLLNARWVFIILVVGITVMGMFVRIMDSSILCIRDKECKPLLENTLGEFLGSQALMNQDIKYINENPKEDASLIQIHKDRLVRSAVISLFMIWLVWKLFEFIFGFALSPEQKNTWFHLICFLIALVVIYLSNVLYLGFSYGVWNFIPLNGFFDPKNGLVFNLDALVQSVGVYKNPLLNQTINQTGAV